MDPAPDPRPRPLAALARLARERPAQALAAVLVAVVLAHAPSLGWGFFIDDYSHQLFLDGSAESETLRPWNLYDFGEGSPEGLTALEYGAFPWWTSTDWKVRFLRPVTSVSLWLDHAVYGRDAVGYHATGLLLFALLAALAYGLWRRLGLSRPAALVALLVLGLEDGGVTAVGWLANRNTLLEALFATAALFVLARAPRPAAAGPLAGALLLCAVAMLSKESGIASAIMVGAYFVLVRREDQSAGPAARRRAVLLAGLLAVLYVATLVALGYGARGPFYPLPWTQPVIYVGRVLLLLATAPLAALSPYPVDLVSSVPAAAWPLAVFGVAIGWPLWLAIWRAVRGHPAAPFLAAWAVVTILPTAGVPTSDRLLFVPMVGAAGLVGLYLAQPRPWPRTALAVALLTLPVSGGALLVRGLGMVHVASASRTMVTGAEVGPPSLGMRDLLLLQTPAAIATLSPLPVWVVETGDREVRFWPLQMGRRPLAWTRTGERTFEIESRGEPFGTTLFESVFLSAPLDVAPGARWTTPVFDVEALAVRDGAPTRIRIELGAPPGPALAFLTWRDGRLSRVEPPAVGETVELEAPEPLVPMLP